MEHQTVEERALARLSAHVHHLREEVEAAGRQMAARRQRLLLAEATMERMIQWVERRRKEEEEGEGERHHHLRPFVGQRPRCATPPDER
jgi:hypothetical protein